VRVTVKLFARLRDLTGRAEEQRDVEPGATVRTLWQALAAEHPAISSYERSISAAVNADYARMDHPLSEGDDVAFLPPVSGG
jgi:molybdopterin converting factor subunit 1